VTPVRRFFAGRVLLALLMAAAIAPQATHAVQALTFAVMTPHAKVDSQHNWQVLAQHLNKELPEARFVVQTMESNALRAAIRQGRVDFVLTEPSEFVRMTHEGGLSAPLATLTDMEAGKPLRVVGGTIVTRKGMPGMVTLQDLSGRQVAVASMDSFEGYQLQAHTLQLAGVAVEKYLLTGEPQDTALQAVLDGRADAAFVGNGLIEKLAREGRLDLGRIQVVNPQNLSGYPFASSTKLYPQWPVLAMPHVREELAVRVSGALLSLPRGGATARAMGIQGFALPTEYEPVRQVMRALKLPPFDSASGVSLRDVWNAYRIPALVFMAGLLAFATAAVRAMVLSRRLKDLNASLELRVQARTSELAKRNDDLDRMLEHLSVARDELVQSAKLASLGALVAGVAHELNTPIGNGLMVATSLDERIRVFKEAMQTNPRRATMEHFVEDLTEAADILAHSLQRAATLVASFKQVAVDQTTSQRRRFDLLETIDEIATSLRPTLKHSGCSVVLPEQRVPVELDSYPGPLGQVLANLINNCIVHGYGEGASGAIHIDVRADGDDFVCLDVRDEGRGIAPQYLDRVFDPFFTTRLGHGGSGLGLHIVHNIVVHSLGGKISVKSQLGQGTVFSLRLPRVAPECVEQKTASGHESIRPLL